MFTPVQCTLFTRSGAPYTRPPLVPASRYLRYAYRTWHLAAPAPPDQYVCVCAIPLSCQVPLSCRPLSRPLTAPSNPSIPSPRPFTFYPLCFFFPSSPLSYPPGPDVPSSSSVSISSFHSPCSPVSSIFSAMPSEPLRPSNQSSCPRLSLPHPTLLSTSSIPSCHSPFLSSSSIPSCLSPPSLTVLVYILHFFR